VVYASSPLIPPYVDPWLAGIVIGAAVVMAVAERPPRSGGINLFDMGGGPSACVLLCCERVDQG
ncbi:hypothetical protein, partial [Nonomuraea sp. NPDC049695]|uniref:hypothetical protein n=1 Tax=Nonomuraea sp. NPDC049695 TaxID=3154734 RepID=UPI003448F208